VTPATSTQMLAFIESMFRDDAAVTELRRMGAIVEANRERWEAEDAQIKEQDA